MVYGGKDESQTLCLPRSTTRYTFKGLNAYVDETHHESGRVTLCQSMLNDMSVEAPSSLLPDVWAMTGVVSTAQEYSTL